MEWLATEEIPRNSSLVASLPDISEFQGSQLVEWKKWFTNTASLILTRTPLEGVTVFYQSDIKYQGEWIDKGYLCQKAAEEAGAHLLWHKIVCRVSPGKITFGRPAFSHVLCFSKSLKLDPGRSTADVLPMIGEKTWERGMGLEACLMVAKFIKEDAKSDTIVNPFCGMGSMLAAANALDLSAIGIERSPKRAQAARELNISEDLKSWT